MAKAEPCVVLLIHNRPRPGMLNVMPLAKPTTDGPKVTGSTESGRDRAVDVARLAALVVVMFGHCALLLATIDADGLHIGNLLGEVPAIRPLTWVAQVMPLFFLAGGAAGAYGYRAGTPWGTWLFTRAQRLCRPVFWYLAVWTVGLLVARMILGAESAARLGRECVALLWFLGVYLVVLAFVPALTRLQSGRAVAVVVASLLAAVAAVDGDSDRRRHARGGHRQLRDRLADPGGDRRGLCAPADRFARGARRRRIRVRRAGGARPDRALRGLPGGDRGGADVQRVAADAVARAALHVDVVPFVAVAGAIRRWAARPRVWHVVAVGNGGAMTLYLWHIPAIAVATFALHAFGLDAYDVDAPGFWGSPGAAGGVFAVVMAVAFRLLSPLEHRRLPWWDAPARATAPGRPRPGRWYAWRVWRWC